MNVIQDTNLGRPDSVPVDIHLSYPFSEEYEYYTQLVRLNLDLERRKDILNDNGFIVSPTKRNIFGLYYLSYV